MTEEQREENINDLVEKTHIRREYYEGLSDERLVEELDKIGLIY